MFEPVDASLESGLMAVLGVFILAAVLRIFLGPTTADRVVALDAVNTLVIALLVSLGLGFRDIIYVDVAIVYAMLAFVSTVYISRYLEGCCR